MKTLRGPQHACHPGPPLPCPHAPSIARADKPARPEDGMEPSLEIWTTGTVMRRKANGGFPDKLALASLGMRQV